MTHAAPPDPDLDAPPLQLALIGAGRMARTHAAVLRTLAEVRIRDVVDPSPDSAAGVAALLGARVRDLDAVLDDPEIRAVFITTPTPTHADLIVRAARAGKAIFVEKPVTDTLEAAAEVVREVEAAGVPCQVGFQRRYDPGYREVKRRIDAGELGRIECFRAVSRDPFPPPLAFQQSAGGILVDMGIHDLDSARFFCGEVREVRAVGAALRDARLAPLGLFDVAVATLRFASGAVGTLENGLNAAYGYEIVAAVVGEAGKFHLEKKQQLPLEVWGEGGVRHDYPHHFHERFPEAYAAEVIAFARNVHAGRPVTPDARDATESLRLALAAQRSLETGETIDVTTFGREASA